jgi:aspartyl-tRNA(Asn)/glutamyl-tRNA(Gln) amidotransferase subunit A
MRLSARAASGGTVRIDRRKVVAGIAGGMAPALLACEPAERRHLARLDIAALSPLLRSGAIAPLDALRACLRRIERFDAAINSFCFLASEEATEAARKAGEEIRKGRWRGPLHGVPIGVKDNIDVAGMPTRAASGALADEPARRDAECVRRLREAGAIILGKLNMHELAVGTTSAISVFGPVRNPWDKSRIAGGSSGGSAAAVAAGLCFGALGTDTGGSIRIPAAACGVVGMKPTHGLVPLDGVVLISASHDHVGPLARSVADAALLTRTLAGRPLGEVGAVKALRVGILQDTDKYCDGAALDPDVRLLFEMATKTLARLASVVGPVDIPYPDLGPIIDLEGEPFWRTLDQRRLAPPTRAGFAETPPPSAPLPDLLAELARFRAGFTDAFEEFDLVVAPTVPTPAIGLPDAADPFAYAACTFAFSQAGAPAISAPCGFSRNGLPIGLMIAGPPGADARVLALAAAHEAATPWKSRTPAL